MKFKEGDVVRIICDKESKPFIIYQIWEDRYYNKNGFYIEKEREDDFEVIGNYKDYDNFITCRDNLYSIIQSMESAVYKIKTILTLDPFNEEDVKEFKEIYKSMLNKMDLFKSRLENIKEDFEKLEK
nr:MAG TPA: hypothetical protein [Caudoviricetes sp.]